MPIILEREAKRILREKVLTCMCRALQDLPRAMQQFLLGSAAISALLCSKFCCK